MKQYEPTIETHGTNRANGTNDSDTQRAPKVRLRAEKPAKGVMGDLMLPPHVVRHAT